MTILPQVWLLLFESVMRNLLVISIALLASCGTTMTGNDAMDLASDVFQDTVAPMDMVVTDTAQSNRCIQSGGMCVPTIRSSNPPGFRLRCPDGTALIDGRTEITIGGALFMGGSGYSNGCPFNTVGTEGSPSGCCLPIQDSGVTDAIFPE